MKCHSCDVRLRDTNVSASADTCKACAAETIGERITLLAVERLQAHVEKLADRPAAQQQRYPARCQSCGDDLGTSSRYSPRLLQHAETCSKLRTSVACSL